MKKLLLFLLLFLFSCSNDILNSISHVDRIYLESLNSEDIKLKIFYYGKMQEIINIFGLSNISIIEQNNQCIIKNESI